MFPFTPNTITLNVPADSVSCEHTVTEADAASVTDSESGAVRHSLTKKTKSRSVTSHGGQRHGRAGRFVILDRRQHLFQVSDLCGVEKDGVDSYRNGLSFKENWVAANGISRDADSRNGGTKTCLKKNSPDMKWIGQSQAMIYSGYNGMSFDDRVSRLCRSCSTHLFDIDCDQTTPEQAYYISNDIPTGISVAFWKGKLTLDPFVVGKDSIEFGTLWPGKEDLNTLLPYFCQKQPGSIEVLCQIALCCGVQHLLEVLVDLNIVGE